MRIVGIRASFGDLLFSKDKNDNFLAFWGIKSEKKNSWAAYTAPGFIIKLGIKLSSVTPQDKTSYI